MALSSAPWLTQKDAPVGNRPWIGGDSARFFCRLFAWREIELGLEGNLGAGPSGLFGFVIKLGGVEGVVEPAAEVVVAGAGVQLAEVVGDLGCDLEVMEEGERWRLGGGE
nr:hypothetical protein Iba_chr12cCG15770 [Ipomoea batatas]